jgi:hypothetical protein
MRNLISLLLDGPVPFPPSRGSCVADAQAAAGLLTYGGGGGPRGSAGLGHCPIPKDGPAVTGPLAGEPRERKRNGPAARRAGAWLVWWVVLMSLWMMLNDSIGTDELLAGAGAAALAAVLAELATYQAGVRFRMKAEWLVPALRLPGR